MRVDEEDFILLALRLLHASVFPEFTRDVGLVEGVVLLHRLHLPLMISHLLDQGGDVRQRSGRGLCAGQAAGGEGEPKAGGGEEPAPAGNHAAIVQKLHASS